MTAIVKACRYPNKITGTALYLMGQLCKLGTSGTLDITWNHLIHLISLAGQKDRYGMAARHGRKHVECTDAGQNSQADQQAQPLLYGPGHDNSGLEK